MAALGELVVSLSANTAKFTEGLNKAAYESKRSFDEMTKSAELFGKVLGGTIIAGAAALAYGVKQAIDAADEMSKASQKIGVTTEALSGLKYAADLSDVSFETLQNGLKKLSVNMDEANSGTLTQVETFYRLGISVTDSAGKMKSADSVLSEIADKFQMMPDGVNKTALAVQAFGKAGAELIPLLNGGSKGLQDLTDEAEMLGLILDTETAKSAEKFNDQLTKFDRTFDGFKLGVAEKMLPALNAIVETLDDTIFGFDKLERAIKKAKGTTEGEWKPIPLITDRPDANAFNLPKEYLAAPQEDFGKMQERLKAEAKAREKLNKEILKDIQNDIDFEVQMFEARNTQVLALEKEKYEERKQYFADWVAEQKAFNAEVENIRNLADPMRKYNAEIQRMGELFTAGAITAEEFSKAAENAQKNMLGFTEKGKTDIDDLLSAIDGFAKNAASAMADFIFGTQTSFTEMVNSMLKDIARLVLQKGLTEPIGDFITGSIPSSGFGNLLGGIFSGGRAQGGSVKAGNSYLVGEYGPEVVTMGNNGTVSQMGNSYNVNVNVDAKGGSVQGDEKQARELGNRINAAIRNVLIQEKRMGGLLA